MHRKYDSVELASRPVLGSAADIRRAQSTVQPYLTVAGSSARTELSAGIPGRHRALIFLGGLSTQVAFVPVDSATVSRSITARLMERESIAASIHRSRTSDRVLWRTKEKGLKSAAQRSPLRRDTNPSWPASPSSAPLQTQWLSKYGKGERWTQT